MKPTVSCKTFYQGNLFYGDFVDGWIRRLTLNANGSVNEDLAFAAAEFVEGAKARALLLTELTGEWRKRMMSGRRYEIMQILRLGVITLAPYFREHAVGHVFIQRLSAAAAISRPAIW